jgi:hypothetical protein
MKIVIQNPTDLSYLTALRQWSPDLREAMVFENFRVAVEFCNQNKLGDVQILLKVEEEDCDVHVPLEHAANPAAAPVPLFSV